MAFDIHHQPIAGCRIAFLTQKLFPAGKQG
jgi:hypothetical protein